MTPCVPTGARLDQPFAASPPVAACARTRQIWEVSATPFTPVSPPVPARTSSVVTPTLGVGYVAMPIEVAVPEPVEGAGLLLTAIELFSNVQAVMTSA